MHVVISMCYVDLEYNYDYDLGTVSTICGLWSTFPTIFSKRS